jgi:hypothetical protein
MAVISTLSRLRQEAHEFQASLGYRARSCLKRKTHNKKEMLIHSFEKPLLDTYNEPNYA